MPRANIFAEKNLGSIVSIRTRVLERSTVTANDGIPFSPDSMTVDAWDPRGTQVLDAVGMDGIVEGEFVYLWNTSALTIPGNYKVVVNATVGSSSPFPSEGVVVLR